MVKNTALNKWRQKAQDDLLWTEANLSVKFTIQALENAREIFEFINKKF